MVTLVTSGALAFGPSIPAAIAVETSPEPTIEPQPVPDPSESPAPRPDPTPEPTPDPTLPPAPDPTQVPVDPTPGVPDPTAPPTIEPSPSLSPDPAGPDPGPSSAGPSAVPSVVPSAGPSADPWTDPVVEPTAAPTPAPTPRPEPAGPHAISLRADDRGRAVASGSGGWTLPTFTVETWFRRADPGSGPAVDVAVDTGEGGLRDAIPLVTRGSADSGLAAGTRPAAEDRIDWFVGIDASTGAMVADFQDRDGRNHPVMGVTSLAQGVWYHAAVTLDGSAFRLYLNGRLEAEMATDGAEPDPAGTAPVALGTTVATDGVTVRGFFDGSVDEARIWRAARTRDDIRRDMREPIDPTADHLVAGWAMDHSGGTTAPDSVESGVELDLGPGTGWVISPVPDPTIPPAPRSLVAVASGDGIALAWSTVDVDDLAGYVIYRAEDGPPASGGTPINGPTPLSDTGWVDDSVAVGVTYRYAVAGVDRFGNESSLSVEAAARVEAPAEAPPMVAVELGLTSTAPDTGRRRVDPGSAVTVVLTATPATTLAGGTLVLGVPDGWTVADASGGLADPDGRRLTWPVADIPAGVLSVHPIALVAPLVSPIDGGADVSSTFTSAIEQPAGVIAGPELTILVGPSVVVEHVIVGQVDELTLVPTYREPDTALTGLQRFVNARVRFQLANPDSVTVALVPQIEVRDPAGGPLGEFVPLPALDGVTGSPFYVAQEWEPVGGRTVGSELSDLGAPIDGLALRLPLDSTDILTPAPGHRSLGPNPAPPLSLPPRTYTEVEFSIRATVDAPYLSDFEFRLTDAGVPIPGATTAAIQTGAEPPLLLSSGQRSGVPVDDTSAMDGTGGIAYRLSPPDAPTPTETPRYGLLVVARPAQGGGVDAPSALGNDPAHGNYAGSTDACAVCHASHSAQGRNLLTLGGPQSDLCFTCHDSAGTGASTRVQAQYTDPAAPANDPSTGSYFRHDALAAGSGHSQAQIDEFGGQSDRHSECGDCHDPHAATPVDSTQTANGWTVSGRAAGTSGVAVTNGAAGAAPWYAFLDGATSSLTLEYQLCFKCHSGFTTLPAKDPAHPSRWALDKGVELNPANGSYHPIEAAGRNTSTAMADSLAGTSPYKLWNFTTGSTVRCVNCHGDPRKATPADPPAPGSDLAPHAATSVVAADGTQLDRGILLQPYRDRALKGPADTYAAVDSALCLVCHKQAPFVAVGASVRTDTNFRYHGKHVSSIRNKGAVIGDIDKPNAGRGNALCSECHYRIHSTASRNDFRGTSQQTGTDGGLVIFAPNVTGDYNSGQVDWTRTGTQSGTCTLTCHGKDHDGKSY